MEDNKIIKINIIKIALKILYNILVVWCILLILIIVMQKITDSNKSIGGYRIFRVVTGSMLPQYDIGEVVICKETPANEIKKGNDIVYRGRIGELSGKIIMHEVVDKKNDSNGKIVFHAKGISNQEEDPEVREEQILGVVKFKSRLLTILYKMATNIYSSFFIILVLVINVFIAFKKDSPKGRIQLNAGEIEVSEEVEADASTEETEDEDNNEDE